MYDDVDDFLAHYGVPGMKWGVRKDRPGGVSRRTNREASKDAKEFARAKMFYGEGAGTRRKLIKNTVEAKSKKDPTYKKAFDTHLNNQDMSTHASKARSERKRKNFRSGTAKTARGVKNTVMQTGATVSILGLGLGLAAKNPKVQSVVMNTGKQAYSAVKSTVGDAQWKRKMRNAGFNI